MIKSRFFRLVTPGLLLAGVALAGDDAQKADLKPKFTVGSELAYTIEANTDSTRVMSGQEMKQNYTQTLSLVRKVSSADENGATAELTIKRVRLKTEGPTGPAEFDSDKPEADDAQNPMAQARQLVGKTFVFTLALDGEVKEVKLPAELPMLAGQEATVKSQFAPLFRVKSSGDPLTAVGETWKQVEDQTAGMMGTLVATGEFKLDSLKDDLATVTLANTLAFKEGGAPTGAEVKEGKTAGTYEWNVKEGALKSYKLQQTVHIVASVQGMDVDVTNVSRTTLTRAE